MRQFSRVTEPVDHAETQGGTQDLSAQPTTPSLGVYLRTSPHHLPPSPMSGESRSILTSPSVHSPHVQELGTRELDYSGPCFFIMSLGDEKH